WNNFGGSYDAAIVNSFTPDSLGWHSVDVTSLVQDWFSGTPNYGLLIEQGENATYYSNYLSSDRVSVNDRPKLEICYTSASSGDACVIIQRTGDTPGDVVDTAIWTLNPDTNYGTEHFLFTGFINGTKQSLLRFDFEVPPPPPPSGGGEGCTPGYWKQTQHFDSWPSPYTSDMLFATVFEDAFPDETMLDALQLKGGGLKALGRHTTAALLNATSPDVDYDLTAAEVIQMFNDVYPGSKSDYNALKNQFETFNELGCPLN
ncbi:MAG: DNRLRE domain-containing protein, partial [Chloroflexi bacterium]|nr:DNRLRE domain-containing protein [Chloroflexota bacterium]